MKNLLTVSEEISYEWTNNRPYYNKLRKSYLDSTGRIRCDRCPYNRVENYKGKSYGGYKGSKTSISYPSWKLASKKPKQWMSKDKMFVEEEVTKWKPDNIYVNIEVRRKKKKR